jgi:hypothetical protein
MTKCDMKCKVTNSTWEAEVESEDYKPEMQCLLHPDYTITSLSIGNLFLRQKRGCPGCLPRMRNESWTRFRELEVSVCGKLSRMMN